MSAVRPDDLETFETVSQNAETRDLFLRMERLSAAGGLNRFLHELSASREIDAETKAAFAEVAQDRVFLRAFAEYVQRTRLAH